MEFDKSRVYTALNADELKVGSKVVVADNIADLKEKVKINDIRTLSAVLTETEQYRFKDDRLVKSGLAYLVSEPEEKKLKWQDVKVGDTLYRKSNSDVQFLVTAKRFDANTDRHLFVTVAWVLDSVLEKEYAKVGDEND